MSARKSKSSSNLRIGINEQRLHVLAMLLEAVGLKRALALCPSEAVRTALGESDPRG
jgi:hypothetical protein